MTRERWDHQGNYYNQDGQFIGCYWNNEEGWWYRLGMERTAISKRTRQGCIKAILKEAQRLLVAGTN